ncbi:MAG: radical SAM protein [Geobacteraceae bacterium]|nr:radical SAM protein [Geobacteraceae bacterium]
MSEPINHTEVFCPECRCPHPAREFLADGKIIGAVACPVNPWQTVLSDHGELFLQFRRQARFDPDYQAPEERPFFFHYLAITDDCNCRCPICFTAAGHHAENRHLSLDEAQRVAETAVRNGVRTVVFVGGEPTVHPQLLELTGIFRRAGIRVWIASNGLRIAQDPGLATRLKRAGAAKVCLQLDSFDEATHLVMRGHGRIKEKIAAARAIADAGLLLGLVCTVTSHNLAELPSFCRTVLSWPRPPHTIAIQGAAHAGRLGTDRDNCITREDIVTSLVAGEAIPGLSFAHFQPIPVLRAMDIHLHPDCAANTVAVITRDGSEPLSAYLDTDKLMDLAAANPVISGYGARMGLLLMGLRCVRSSGWRLLARHCIERLKGGRGVRFCFIGTGAFLRRDYLDMARIRRCASGSLAADGCESLCKSYSRQPFDNA